MPSKHNIERSCANPPCICNSAVMSDNITTVVRQSDSPTGPTASDSVRQRPTASDRRPTASDSQRTCDRTLGCLTVPDSPTARPTVSVRQGSDSVRQCPTGSTGPTARAQGDATRMWCGWVPQYATRRLLRVRPPRRNASGLS